MLNGRRPDRANDGSLLGFVAIDDAAKHGRRLLLRAVDGSLHSGIWNGRAWAYASNPHVAMNREIAAYLPRPKSREKADGPSHR